ncbi:MAG TPA: L-threonylcarbamoyladenylate synthase [Acidimicrobiia bacterium]|nr:L-threonylcarbamoyladenylate synthase [Acidimicrobiia bacterium]
MSSSSAPSASSISDAVAALRRGGVVVFPTETVYGVGADARNAAAVGRVFEVKGRPAERAVTVHISTSAELERWAADPPARASLLADAFWPGPLTIVVPARADVLDVVRGGGDTVGLRVPDHPVAYALLAEFGDGIVGSSANRHGHPAAVTADAAASAIPGADAYLVGGECLIGQGSTVIDLVGAQPIVRRLGAVTVEQLSTVLGVEVLAA